jgi:hypothetical protein
MPRGARILHLALQNNEPHIWAEVESTASFERRFFHIVGTGFDIDSFDVYIGTYQLPPFVWHVYEVKR